MRFNLKLFSLVFICQLIFPGIVLAKGIGAVILSKDSLQSSLAKVEKKIRTIHTNSAAARAISEEYRDIATKHGTVVLNYTKQKASCLNMEDEFAAKNTNHPPRERIKRYQSKKVNSCYQTLKIMTVNFDVINEDFVVLTNAIRDVQAFADVDRAEIDALEAQLNTLGSQIELEKANVKKVADKANKLANRFEKSME